MLNYKMANLTRILLVIFSVISFVGGIVLAGKALFAADSDIWDVYLIWAFYAFVIGCVLNVFALATAYLMWRLGLEPEVKEEDETEEEE